MNFQDIKVGDRVTVRRGTEVISLDTVKSTCKRWVTLTGGGRYDYEGSIWKEASWRISSPRDPFALPFQEGDQEVYDKAQREAADRKEQAESRNKREDALRSRFWDAIEARENPTPLFKAMTHFISTGGEYDYDLLAQIEDA